MKKVFWSTLPLNRIRSVFPVLLFFLNLTFPISSRSVELDPYPIFDFSRDSFSISMFREERPSFYWVNVGVPDLFFNGVQQTSFSPSPTVYSVRSIEYGTQVKGWVDDQAQLRMTIPYEANAIVDPSGNTHNVEKVGDIEIAGTYLLIGQKEKGDFIGVDGRFRFPTGTNPFELTYPLLSTGKGASEEALGLVMAEELGGFSFFQSIHYEKTQPITLNSSNPLLGAGVFQWPDNLEAEGRVEWLFYHRAERYVSIYYDFSMRASGLMEFNHQVLTYGQILNQSKQNIQTTDRLFFSTLGLVVKVDPEFSAEGRGVFFPYEPPVDGKGRPDFGLLFSLSLIFRPL